MSGLDVFIILVFLIFCLVPCSETLSKRLAVRKPLHIWPACVWGPKCCTLRYPGLRASDLWWRFAVCCSYRILPDYFAIVPSQRSSKEIDPRDNCAWRIHHDRFAGNSCNSKRDSNVPFWDNTLCSPTIGSDRSRHHVILGRLIASEACTRRDERGRAV